MLQPFPLLSPSTIIHIPKQMLHLVQDIVEVACNQCYLDDLLSLQKGLDGRELVALLFMVRILHGHTQTITTQTTSTSQQLLSAKFPQTWYTIIYYTTGCKTISTCFSHQPNSPQSYTLSNNHNFRYLQQQKTRQTTGVATPLI